MKPLPAGVIPLTSSAVVIAVIVAEIAIAIAVPSMIVLHPAAVALPVACKELAPVIARPNPAGARIRRTSPISVMPPITVSGRIPVTVYPEVIGSRSSWPGMNDARRRRGPDSYADG